MAISKARIHVFFHIAGINHAREICREIAGQVCGSGLYDVADTLNACIVGPPKRFSIDYCFWPRWCIKFNGDIEDYEYPTQRWAWERARQDPHSLILYIHTKSASKADGRRRVGEGWRRIMAYHTIERWRECVEALAEFDTVGSLLTVDPYPHYSGNFFWSRASYMARLPMPAARWPGDRLYAEEWLLSVPGKSKSMFQLAQGFRPTINRDLYREVGRDNWHEATLIHGQALPVRQLVEHVG